MVILAAAVTTKTGKALLSRQFVDISRVRIEGLLAAFPKLMGSEKQHTFIETDTVRYLYQPLESLYILLVTNKSSNILEDLETLHLLAKIVPEYSRVLEEKEVVKNAFDIVFAFDEAVAMGYKERVNLQQIKHFTTMESHDEIRHNLEQKNKMNQAKREAEQQRKKIEKKKNEERRAGLGGADYHGTAGLGGSGYGAGMSIPKSMDPVVETKKETPKVEPKFSKGMRLGKGPGAKTAAYTQILKEENVQESAVEASTKGGISQIVESPLANEKVKIIISEKLVLVSQNDGGLENMEIKGELIINVFDNSCTKVKVQVSQGENKDFQFKAHPNMDKNMYSNDNVLALKDNKAYPIGVASSILKWRYVSKDEKMIPLTINVWPSSSGGQTTVPVEYEKHCDFDLVDVVVAIPIPGPAPVVGEIGVGSTDFDSKKGVLFWRIPLIDDSNKSGSMEFNVPNAPNSAFFPVQVDFRSNQTYCAIQVVQVNGDQTVDFASDVSLSVEQYEIQ